MGIVSYAQNFEDVMLWRALGHVEHGFYIDVGAQDPVVDSVSMAFHERGWRGIHVEPVPYYAEMLRESRPGDVVIQAAVGDGSDVMRFFEIPGTGISTGNPTIAQQHREQGFEVREITVPCISLSSIFEYCGDKDVHWLKIDVEGLEREVLSSWGEPHVRPWIVVVESTVPTTSIQSHECWESIIIDQGYVPVYFDGLNRYYVSNLQPALASAFVSPPNVFDGFTLSGTSSSLIHKTIEERLSRAHDLSTAEFEAQLEAARSEVNRHVELEKMMAAELEAAVRDERERGKNELLERERSIRKLARQALSRARHDAQTHRREIASRERAFREVLERVQSEARKVMAEQLHLHAEGKEKIQEQLVAARQELARLRADGIERAKGDLQMYRSDLAAREQFFAERLAEVNAVARDAAATRERLLAEREGQLQAELVGARDELAMLQASIVEREELGSKLADGLAQSQAHAQQLLEELRRHVEIEGRLRNDIEALREVERNLRGQVDDEAERAAALTAEIASIRGTILWRFTVPLRKIAAAIARSGETPAPSTFRAATTEATALAIFESSNKIITKFQAAHSESLMNQFVLPSFNVDASAMPSTLSELLDLQAQQFVIFAYRIILGREPDPEGLRYYLQRLRSGVSKIHVLAQIRRSPEGKMRPATIHGLDRAIRRHQLLAFPLIGALLRMLGLREFGRQPLDRLEALENALQNLQCENVALFREIEEKLAGQNIAGYQQIEKTVAALNALVLRQSQASPSSACGSDPGVQKLTSVECACSQTAAVGFSRELPGESEIFWHLKHAIATKSKARGV